MTDAATTMSDEELWDTLVHPAGTGEGERRAALVELLKRARELERELCVSDVLSYPDCDCAQFCECYGKASFRRLATRMRGE